MWDDGRITKSELCPAVGIREPAVMTVRSKLQKSLRKVGTEAAHRRTQGNPRKRVCGISPAQ